MIRIPHITRKSFKKHFIKNGFLEVRFQPITVDWSNFVAKYKPYFASLGYSGYQPGMKANFQLKQVDGKMKLVTHTDDAQDCCIFVSDDKAATIQIHNSKMVFQSQKYLNFENFLQAFVKLSGYFFKEEKITALNFIGLRKVNELVVKDEDNKGYVGSGINNNFFTPIKGQIFDPISVQLGENRYVLKNEQNAVILTATVQRQMSNEYVLNLDIDWQSILNVSLETADTFTKEVTRLNESLFDTYCWMISDDLRKELEK